MSEPANTGQNDSRDRERVEAYLATCDPSAFYIEDVLGEMEFFRSPEYRRAGEPSDWIESPYEEHERGLCTICDALRILAEEAS